MFRYSVQFFPSFSPLPPRSRTRTQRFSIPRSFFDIASRNKGRDPHSWNSHMSGIKTILNRELTFFLYLHPFVSVIIDKWTRKLVFFSEKFQFMGFCIEKHGVLFLIPTAKLIILILGRIILRRRERLVFLKKNKFWNFRREEEIKFHYIKKVKFLNREITFL